MWLLIVPVVILFVLIMAVASLAAGLFWMMGATWPWLLIGLGIWMLWHEDGRHRRTASRAPVSASRRPPVQPSQPDKAERKKAGPRPLRQTELPIDIQVKVEQIRRKVDVLLGYADRFPPFSQDLYLVRQTANDYLPSTISAYLALPNQTADKPLSANGQTAHQELKAQLDLLDARLDDIAQDLERQDTDRLLANRRFLEDRFGLRAGQGSRPDVA
jgi:ABC-type nickel/cobalt efflux system permease component RcnA